MKRLTPGKSVQLVCPDHGRLAGRVVATAGPWTLLSLADPAALAPEWLDGEVHVVFFEGADAVKLRGSAQPGDRPGELRFLAGPAGKEDARRAPRVPMMQNATLLGPSGALLEAEVVDLGAGGVRVRHHGSFVSGDRVRIQLKLPDGPRVDADAVVKESWNGTSVLVFVDFRTVGGQSIAEWCVDELRRRTAPGGATRPGPRPQPPTGTWVA